MPLDARAGPRLPATHRIILRAKYSISMSATIKTADEIAKMRVAGRLAAEVLHMIRPHVKAGVTTEELNQICHDYIVNVQQAIPAPLNYHGFPKSICTSVNHQVCHGIPGKKRLKDGDIINIDVTVIKDGYHGDTSKMFFVGDASPLARRLEKVTYECMRIGIEMVKPGVRLGDIGPAKQQHAESHNYSLVREYCGHGNGRNLHHRAHGECRQAPGEAPARQLDRGHQGSQPLRAMGTHHFGHRQRLRGADQVPGRRYLMSRDVTPVDPPPFDDPSLATSLADDASRTKSFRAALKQANEQIKAQFLAGTPAHALVHLRARRVDELLKKVWPHWFDRQRGVSLVAVGGYGRGALHPGSDIDVQIIVDSSEVRETLRDHLGDFVTFLWDIGLEVGHSVRTVAECTEEAAKDITVATNLMEARHLAAVD